MLNCLAGRLFRVRVAALLLWMIGPLGGLQVAAQGLRIASPVNGSRIESGSRLTISVEADPGAFVFVYIAGSLPGANSMLHVRPYRFTLEVPRTLPSGDYTVNATGYVAPGQKGASDAVTVDIERPDRPARLESEASVLRFHALGASLRVLITGTYSDGSSVVLDNSRLSSYQSDRPSVATVDSAGRVTACGFGSANITVTNMGTKLVVPVVVTPSEDAER